MKNVFKISLLAGALCVIGGGLGSVAHANRSVFSVAHADEYETAIAMDASFFTNWTALCTEKGKDLGVFRAAGTSYWGGSFNAFGSFFDGCTDNETEKLTYTLNSRKWKQSTQYIYFQMGCALDNHKDEANDVRLEFKLFENNSDTVPYATYKVWNDTFCGVTMLLRNLRISDEDFAHFNGQDFYMSVDLIDGRENDYGAHVFGNLHVNQTLEEVSDAQWYYFNHCVGVTDGDHTKEIIQNHYRLNGSIKNGYTHSFYESFDTQANFDKHFVLTDYGRTSDRPRHADRVISNSTYRSGTNMPFNNTNGFFKGWYGGANDDYDDHIYGFVDSDYDVYRFISKPFYLPANGIVSVKMAGNAASLHLIDFINNTDLGWVDNKVFTAPANDDEQKNIALSNVNTCTMVRHVINFSKYAGQLVQLAIADVDTSRTGGWTAAYFDELRADYQEVPALKVDVVEQYVDDLRTYSAINDRYITSVEANGGVDYALNDGPDSDSSALLGASTFVNSYMSLFRNNHSAAFCTTAVSNDAKNLLDSYKLLSEDSQRLVCASDDYQRVNGSKEDVNNAGDWYKTRPTFDLDKFSTDEKKLGYSVAFLAATNAVAGVTVYGSDVVVINPMYALEVRPVYVVVLSSVLISFVAFASFVVIKRRKKQR